jgi:hypothetical protein
MPLTISDEEIEIFTAKPAVKNELPAFNQKINAAVKLDTVVKESQATNPEKWSVPVNQFLAAATEDAYTPETKLIYKAIEIVQTSANSQKAALQFQKLGITSDFFNNIEINNKFLNQEALQQILAVTKRLLHEIEKNNTLEGIDYFKALTEKLRKTIVAVEKQITLLDQKKTFARELYAEELASHVQGSIKKFPPSQAVDASIAEIIGNFKLESKAMTEKLREIRFEARKKEDKLLADYVEKTEQASLALFKFTDKKVKAKNIALMKEIELRLEQKEIVLKEVFKSS